MKTIRHATFETNSSSTHAYSLIGMRAGLPAEYMRHTFNHDSGVIEFSFPKYGFGEIGNSAFEKARFLLAAVITLNPAKIEMVTKVIIKNTGCSVTLNHSEPIDAENMFYKFLHSEYGTSLEEFTATINSYLTDEASIEYFIFSGMNPFDRYEYYDG